MEFLVALAPIALIVFLCGGMMFFMMRGMHGGAERGSAHGTHGEQQGTGLADTELLEQLESGVSPVREQVAVSGKGTNGADRSLTAPDPAGRRSDP